jgi:hypothetical protein
MARTLRFANAIGASACMALGCHAGVFTRPQADAFLAQGWTAIPLLTLNDLFGDSRRSRYALCRSRKTQPPSVPADSSTSLISRSFTTSPRLSAPKSRPISAWLIGCLKAVHANT